MQPASRFSFRVFEKNFTGTTRSLLPEVNLFDLHLNE